MHYTGKILVCGLFALAPALTPRVATAQLLAPSERDAEVFSAAELLAGKTITETECSTLRPAVWVVVQNRGECIRYYQSAAGGTGEDALVFLHGDVVSTNGRGEAKAHDYYAKSTAASLHSGSASWSRSLQMPYIHLARPGTYGSSGAHAQRRTQREIDVVSAALDAIKAAHGYHRLHLAGYAEGGHTAAALLAQRTELGLTRSIAQVTNSPLLRDATGRSRSRRRCAKPAALSAAS